MPVSYIVAKDVLNETDKNRIMCCYLNSKNMNDVDWKKAADEFGSASVESFRKMVQTAFKKVSAAEANGGAAPAATPRGKKRKNDGDGEGEGPKKKGGRKAKKATTPITDKEDAAGENVKLEDGEKED